MKKFTYQQHELEFAYCYRIYLRWQTHRRQKCAALATLSQDALHEIGKRFDIHVLEATHDDTESLTLLSLKPQEAVATATSKLKGQISKLLREAAANPFHRRHHLPTVTSPAPRARPIRRPWRSISAGNANTTDTPTASYRPCTCKLLTPPRRMKAVCSRSTRTRCCNSTSYWRVGGGEAYLGPSWPPQLRSVGGRCRQESDSSCARRRSCRTTFTWRFAFIRPYRPPA